MKRFVDICIIVVTIMIVIFFVLLLNIIYKAEKSDLELGKQRRDLLMKIEIAKLEKILEAYKK